MNKQELIKKLAIECETWEYARETAVGEVFLGNVEWEEDSPNITKQDWLDERERLLNETS